MNLQWIIYHLTDSASFSSCRSGKQVTIDLNSLDEIIQLLCCGLGLVNPTCLCQEAPCKYLDLSHNPDPLLSCSETGKLQAHREKETSIL